MRSVPTTSIDLTDPAVVADPYPHFAAERARHEVAWHEPSGTWLTFSHAAASAVLRDRGLGPDLAGPGARGVPRAVQPAAPQPDDGERAARAHPAAAGGGRRVQPRSRRAAASAGAGAGRLAAGRGRPRARSTSSGSTPSRCPSWSSPSCVGLADDRRPRPARVVAGDRADVRARPVARRGRRRRPVCRGVRRPRARAPRASAVEPRGRPDHRPARRRAVRRRAGGSRRAAAQRRPRGVGQRLRQRPGRAARARTAARRRPGA